MDETAWDWKEELKITREQKYQEFCDLREQIIQKYDMRVEAFKQQQRELQDPTYGIMWEALYDSVWTMGEIEDM